MRVVHLLDPASCGDEGVLCCAAMLTAGVPGALQECWIIGGADDERRAWSLGIPSTDRVTARPGPLAGGSLAPLRRLAGARRGGPRIDLVQCWSGPALGAAREVFGSGPGSPVRVCVIAGEARTRDWPGPTSDDALATAREVAVALDHPTRRSLAARLSAAGPAAAGRWIHSVRLIEPPAFPRGGPVAVDRAATRAELGIEASDVVMGVLADPPALADAQRLVFMAGVVNAAGHRTVLLMRRGARQERRAAAYLRAHEHRWGFAMADLSLAELIGVSDLCVIDTPHTDRGEPVPTCGPTAVALAFSMGIPVVALPLPPGDGGAGNEPPVVRSASPLLSRLAHPIVQLLEHPEQPVATAAAIRSWCDHARARDGFRTVLRDIWLEATNQPAGPHLLPRPLEPATAGV